MGFKSSASEAASPAYSKQTCSRFSTTTTSCLRPTRPLQRNSDQLGCYDKIREWAGDIYYKAKGPGSNTKRVSGVDITDEGVTVHTKDDSVYTEDIVAGADGVHSAIRQEMCRLPQEDNSELFDPDQLNGLQSKSKFTFNAFQVNAFFTKCSYLIFSPPKNRLYWFLITETLKAHGSGIPRFTKDGESALVEQHFADQIIETTCFRDIYTNGFQTTLVALEDHFFPRWYFRRTLTVGDAAQRVVKLTQLALSGKD